MHLINTSQFQRLHFPNKMCKTRMTIHKTCADYESSMMENVKPHDARTGRGTQETGQRGTSLIRRQVSELHRLRCSFDRTQNVSPLLLPPLKVPMIWAPMKKKRNSNISKEFCNCSCLLPYHSQQLPAWEMSACHCLTRLCSACGLCVLTVHVSGDGALRHLSVRWIEAVMWRQQDSEGREDSYRAASPSAHISQSNSIYHPPPHSSPPRLSHSECDGWTPLAFISTPWKKQSWVGTPDEYWNCMFWYTWSNRQVE